MPDQHTTPRDWVNGQLRLRGLRPGQVARRLGISPSYATDLLAGRKRSASRQRQIARLAGMDPAEMFGEFAADELRSARGEGDR